MSPGEMMDGGKLPDRKTGSVKAAVSYFAERTLEGNPTTKKLHTNYPEKPYTKTRELHEAKRDSNQFKESKRFADMATAEAKSELTVAKKTVKDLTLRIEESNSRTKSLGKLKMGERDEGARNSDWEKVMRELETIKRELSKLKLDMASVMEEKRKAEREIEYSLSKTESCSSSVEALNKEIEEVNEEHVLVELARIEAVKEYEEIEAQKGEKAEEYSALIEKTRKIKENMVREIDNAEELERKLAITTSDIDMLERELKQVKEMEKGIERNEILMEKKEEELVSASLMEELEAARKELATVKEESFQFMASMDIVRNELKHVVDQTAKLRKKEGKTEMTIQNLNSKLLRAKAKLEENSAAEEKAKSIASNLTLTLEQIKSEAETAKKERSLISEETAIIKAEIQRTEMEIDSSEEKLQAALQDLKAVKSSEAQALENLKAIIEKTVRSRASASRPSSTITISKFEYDYLTEHAGGAREIADKKVAAAEAWAEALKASEREIVIKTELMRRENREMRVDGEELEKKKVEEGDFEKWRQKMEPEKLKGEMRGVKMTPTRRGKSRMSASAVIRGTPGRSSSFTVRRRKKAMPNLAKFFSGKSAERNLEPV